jgi:DNA gyrase subunit A
MKKFKLSEKQADAILEMPLRTLTQMERHKILEELKERRSIIKELELILKSPKKIDEIIISEADEIKGISIFEKDKYGFPLFAQVIKEEKEALLNDETVKKINLKEIPLVKRVNAPKKIQGINEIKSVFLF